MVKSHLATGQQGTFREQWVNAATYWQVAKPSPLSLYILAWIALKHDIFSKKASEWQIEF